MANLTAAKRKKIPKSEMGLPKKKGPRGGAPKGTFPMPDKAHARNAKARASEGVNKGTLSKSQKAKIDAKANKVLGKTKAKKKATAPKRSKK